MSSAAAVHLAEAVRRLNGGDFAGAEASCRAALAADPQAADAHHVRGVALAQLGRAGEADAAFAEALRLRPGDPNMLFNRALALQQAGRPDDAIRAYDAAAAAGHPAALGNLGALLLQLDRPAEAEAVFRKSVQRGAGDPRAAEGLGVALLQQRKYAEARAAFEAALAAAPRSASAHANLGASLHLLEARDAALRHYRQAIALDPDNADFHAQLSTLLLEMRDLDGALAANDAALRLQPGHTRALSIRPMILGDIGRFDDVRALVDFDRIVRLRTLPVPAGFADGAAFRAALEADIRAHPTLVRARPNKTTRNGGQTGELFAHRTAALDALRAGLILAVQDYAAALDGAPHPFRAARPGRWTLRAWATLLHSGGYQAPHCHPGGWLSGVFYVKVPEVVGRAAGGDQGCIEFGRPDPVYGYRYEPETRIVRPQAGGMILFPSYIWHRTLPFGSSEDRISVAFDVLPA